MRTILALAIIFVAAGATPAIAQEDTTKPKDKSAFSLGEIVVVGSPEQVPQISSETLSGEAMYTFDRTTLDDAVNLMPGVSSGNSGGTRNERLIFVRGFNRFEVPLTIDGIRVYLPADNRLDFGRFLTSDIAEVQVAKSYVSVLNGPDGMGGAVNLVTRKPTRELEADVRGTLNLGHGAEYSGYNLSALLGSRHDKWYAQASFARNFTDHWDLADGYTPTAIQGGGRRDLSRTADWRVNVKAGFTPNATDEYSINYTRQEGSKLAPLSVVDPLASQKFWTWPAWNADSVYFLSSTQLDTIATLKTRLYRNTFYNLLRSFNDQTETTQTKGYAFNSPYWDQAHGGSTELDLKPSARERLSVSAQYRLDQHQEAQQSFPSGLTAPRLTDKEATYSLGIENERMLAPHLSLLVGAGYDWRHLLQAQNYGAPLGQPLNTPSMLYDYPRRDSSTWSGQGQLSWEVTADTALHASISSRGRFPTLFERFSQRFGTSVPNPSLQPERATNYEIGGSHQLGAAKLEAAAFYSHITNAIVSEPTLAYACTASTTPGPCAQTVLNQSRNLGTGNFYGAELSLNAQLFPQFSFGANYTYTHRKLVDPANAGFRPTDVPTHKAFVYADWTPMKRLHLIPSADIASNRWTVTDVAPIIYFRTGAFVNAAARAQFDVRDNAQVSIGVRNLFDDNYQLVSGYPEQGRSFFASFRANY